MAKRRSRRSADTKSKANLSSPKTEVRPASGRYVRWRNETGRAIEGTIGETVIQGWTPGLTRSVPEDLSEDAEAVGLTRVGYAQ